ncbi:CNH domain-containing protein [Lactarius hengduanensis]|nr:CNH domain-containing protein [Lactarius hengduanensis]
MEYITNYPIAEYRIIDEMANNPTFKEFVEQCTRHPDANRLDMKNFVNRPIPRLARYELLLKGIMEASHDGHEDHESIPQVIEVINSLLEETQPGVASAEQKVELWRYNANLVFKPGEAVDMDLLAKNRSLIHAGKLLRQPDTGFEWSGWSELFVLLFDNICTSFTDELLPKEKDGITKYNVNRRPIPLDLLTLSNFIDPPTRRGTGLLRGFGGNKGGGDTQANTPDVTPDTATDSRVVYPSRSEWKEKLEEAIGLRKVVQESITVFEVETLSSDTFVVPSMLSPPTNHSWNAESSFMGKVTCSVPFTTVDGCALVAVGCAEGVWIGFRHDSRSMRRVLHLKMVTQCVMLEDFRIFLVLADKSLFAYHIEALVPTSLQSANTTQTPQKLNGSKDVHFFSVGSLGGRALVIYMKKKGLDSVFRVLEPVVGKINEKAKAPVFLTSRFGLRQPRSEWFRIYRDFFLPSESYDLIFLKARIAILCFKTGLHTAPWRYNGDTAPWRCDSDSNMALQHQRSGVALQRRRGSVTLRQRHGASTTTQRHDAAPRHHDTNAARCYTDAAPWPYNTDTVLWPYDTDTMHWACDTGVAPWRYDTDAGGWACDTDVAPRHYDTDTARWAFDTDRGAATPTLGAGPATPTSRRGGTTTPTPQAGPATPTPHARPATPTSTPRHYDTDAGGWTATPTLRRGTTTPTPHAGPSIPTSRRGATTPTLGARPATPTSRRGTTTPTPCPGPTTPTPCAGPATPASRCGATTPTLGAGPATPTLRHGTTTPTPHAGPATPTSRRGTMIRHRALRHRCRAAAP